MELLYKESHELTTEVHIEQTAVSVALEFTKDCGKFGTDEIVDAYELTPERLLFILQEHGLDNYFDEELG